MYTLSGSHHHIPLPIPLQLLGPLAPFTPFFTSALMPRCIRTAGLVHILEEQRDVVFVEWEAAAACVAPAERLRAYRGKGRESGRMVGMVERLTAAPPARLASPRAPADRAVCAGTIAPYSLHLADLEYSSARSSHLGCITFLLTDCAT